MFLFIFVCLFYIQNIIQGKIWLYKIRHQDIHSNNSTQRVIVFATDNGWSLCIFQINLCSVFFLESICACLIMSLIPESHQTVANGSDFQCVEPLHARQQIQKEPEKPPQYSVFQY